MRAHKADDEEKIAEIVQSVQFCANFRRAHRESNEEKSSRNVWHSAKNVHMYPESDKPMTITMTSKNVKNEPKIRRAHENDVQKYKNVLKHAMI